MVNVLVILVVNTNMYHDDQKVKFLLENPEEYNKYHAWRSHYTGMERTSNTETINNPKRRLVNQTQSTIM